MLYRMRYFTALIRQRMVSSDQAAHGIVRDRPLSHGGCAILYMLYRVMQYCTIPRPCKVCDTLQGYTILYDAVQGFAILFNVLRCYSSYAMLHRVSRCYRRPTCAARCRATNDRVHSILQYRTVRQYRTPVRYRTIAQHRPGQALLSPRPLTAARLLPNST
jgi:hypothetical protein